MCADRFLKYYGECIERESTDHAENDSIETMLAHPALECRDETDAMEMLCRENVVYSTLDYEDETVRGTRISEDQWKRSGQSREARKAVTDAVGGILLSVIRVVLVIRTASSVIFISQVWVLRSAAWIPYLSVRWTFRFVSWRN